MTPPLVKICGLSTLETLTAALDAGADWVGFVHFEKSPRHVEGEQAASLARAAKERAKIVSLTVNADDTLLEDIIKNLQPDILQLHGKETPKRVQEIKTRFGLPIMKAIGVGNKSDLEKITPFLNVADHILLDAKPPKEASLPGGNGVAFDWSILNDLPKDISFVLSGGLTPDNLEDAIKQTKPFGLDVSSGVESAPGIKDIGLINRFVEISKTA